VATWEALLEKMPMTAMLRNLGVMAKVGLLTPMSAAEQTIIDRLADTDRLHQARIHPIALLSALRVYAQGRGVRGRNTWTPTPRVIDALDAAFYLAFQNVEPANKRLLLALDVSGSMSMGMIAGVPGLTPRNGSAAMALVTARTEPQYDIISFQDRIVPLNISANMRLDDAVKATHNLPFGRTDCAQPMLYALDKKLKVDTFVIYTDSETWFGKIHPVQALQRYRETTGIPAQLIVVGMVSNGFSIADPNDAGMLDVVGFDSATPRIMSNFARGQI
jgi:60 kDa SS-A/Ro ribonucleoprotein